MRANVSMLSVQDRHQKPLVVVRDLVKEFRHRRSSDPVRAVDGVSVELARGGAVGLVGESGSGKTTVARCILGLTPPTHGSIMVDGVELTTLSEHELRAYRRHMQMVFQNPYDSLNPRWKIKDILEEPLILQIRMTDPDRRKRIAELCHLVRLDERLLDRYPHQLSGGQQQRVGIARSLATHPDFVVLDEPTSALDTITRVEILDLLNRLRRELGLTYLFISHDLSAVRRVCDQISVMYLGQIVEQLPTEALFCAPCHPYTRSLLSAILEPRVGGKAERLRLHGEPPSPIAPPSGCRLHPRCPVAMAECAREIQVLREVEPNHRVACWRVTSGQVLDWPASSKEQ